MLRQRVAGLVLAAFATAVVAAEPVSPGARSRFFDFEVRGRRIAFVCDRSASMGEPAGRPLAAAKEGLMASIEALGDSQQFHLFFYSDRVTVYSPPGGPGRPIFADPETLRGVRRFTDGMAASGGTRHADALAASLAVAPDEIYFLTDGDPRDDLAADELERLSGKLGRTRLFVVQFSDEAGGSSDASPGSPRLAKLATTSGGGYRAVDPTADE